MNQTNKLSINLLAIALLFASGCYAIIPSNGGGKTSFQPPRRINAADIALPPNYRIEPVAVGLTFPSGITFDENGRPYVVETGYSYGEVWSVPRLLRIESDGRVTEVAKGEKNGPWTSRVQEPGPNPRVPLPLSGLAVHSLC